MSLRPACPTSRWLFTAALMLLVSCLSGDRPAPTEVRVTGAAPAFQISDAVHSGGTAGFFFLPPMVPQPTVTGVFDADIGTVNPRVVICDVTDGPGVDCGGATPAQREYTTAGTPAIVIEGEKYKVDWNTTEGEFVAGRTYRVHVQGGTGPNRRQLGFADILLTTEPGKAKNLANGDVIVLNDGRTLPIHFRIEEDVILPPGDARSFELRAPASVVAGTPASVTVIARDANGQVATGYRGTVAFTSSDPQATLPADYVFTEGDEGMHTFTGAVVLRKAGPMPVRAADAADAAIFGEVTVTVQPSGATKLRLSDVGDQVTAGVAHDLTVTALDAFDNTATGYTGTVQFTSTDAAASLPSAYQFTAADAGAHTFSAGVTFRTAGEQSLRATDATTSTITGSLGVTVDAAAAAALRFTTQPSDAIAGESIMPPVVVTAFDAFANVATTFTGQVAIAIGTNPGSGALSGTLTRTGVAGVATFDDVRISAGGTGYTLVASATDLTGATSEPFDIITPTPVEVHWINPSGGLWSVASNWSTGTVPTAEQSAFIDLSGTYTVTLDVNASVNSLTVGVASGASGVQALNASGRTLTVVTSGYVLNSGRVTLTNSTVNGAGTLTIASGGVLSLSQTSTVGTTLDNAGSVLVGIPPFFSNATIAGTFTTHPGSFARMQAHSSNTSSLTVASGFTNHGTIELTKSGDAIGGSSLVVSSGTLINAPDGVIRSVAGSGGGRTLTAQLDNRGTLELAHVLTINRASATHANSGTIAVNGGNLTLTQSGTTPSFTNTGTVAVAAGRTWTITGGSFTQASGATLDGGGAMTLGSVNPALFGSAFTLSALTLASTNATFSTDVTTETTALSFTNSTVNGSVTLTNAAGKTLPVTSSIINTAFVNAGTFAAGVPPFVSSTTINGAFITVAGSLVRVQAHSSNTSSLTVASGFTNHGTIELTKSGDAIGGSSLVVSSGTLINAPEGVIRSVAGSGGGRTLNAQLDNQGTLELAHVLTINRASATHANSGTIAVNGGDLTLTQSGTTPSFTNTGTVVVAAGRSWAINGGTVTNSAGASIEGDGTFQSATNTALSNAGNVTVALARIGDGLTSTGTFAPVTAEFFATTATIPVGVGYSYTNVRVLGAATFAGSASLAGNLNVAGSGNLTIGAHEISVAANFATQNSALLTMQNSASVLTVSGNASFGGGSTNTRLTAGTLRVGGNFIQAGGSAAAFAPSTNHVTVLNGSGAQSVSFATPGTTTLLSHFHRLQMDNASAGGVTLATPVFANGQLRTPAGSSPRTFSSAGQTLQVGGLDAAGLVFDATQLRVMNGDALVRFDDAIFRNMDPAATQFRLDRLADAVTFNNTQFLTVPTTGVYLHLVDTDLAEPLFTLTMQGTQPPNHGGKIIESLPGQLIGWSF